MIPAFIRSKRKTTDMTNGLPQNGVKLRQALFVLFKSDEMSARFGRHCSEPHVRATFSYTRRQSSMF